jgi:uncharacterized protein (TIGR03435 family)
MMPSGISLAGGKVSMTEFVRGLQLILGRPVMNGTGITEPFDLSLTFARDEITAGLPRPMVPAAPESGLSSPLPDAPIGPPSILAAIQEQLGLKLESAKGPVEVIVIDHVERPSAN